MCYNTAEKESLCPDMGQDGDIRAALAWPNPRFIGNLRALEGQCAEKSIGFMLSFATTQASGDANKNKGGHP